MLARMLSAFLLLSCNGGDPAPEEPAKEDWRPALVCPGDAGCRSNSGPLAAGASARSITPTCFETWEDVNDNAEYDGGEDVFLDCGCDQLCEGDEGWPGADQGEGDGEFQAIWIAGFGTARAAAGVHDDLWARAIVFESGDTRVAIVALDLVGWFFTDVERIREEVAAAGADIDLVVVQATHQHEGPDTLGQWGRRVGERGVDDDYVAFVVDEASAAVVEAAADLQPAVLKVGEIDTAAPFGAKGTRNTVRDSRDPVVIEEMLQVAWFGTESGETIATLVNWGNHPEVMSSDNLLLTSDFAHYLREGVEQGVEWESGDRAGVGGVCVYLQGMVGGLMTPLGITVTDFDGVDHSEADWPKTEALGKIIADLSLQALETAVVADAPTVSAWGEPVFIPMENVAFQAMYLLGVFDRPAFNYDPNTTLDEDNIPELLTEVDLIELGPIRMLTVPGELAPELALGGYDGSRVNTDEVSLIAADNPLPPDLAAAPEGPYYYDHMGASYNWILGLANDEVGYLIPSYDYVLHDTIPYLDQAEGDHYEETNSVGPSAVPRLDAVVAKLADYAGPPQAD